MSGIHIDPWEPEETVGKLWHRFASQLDAPQAHVEESANLSEFEKRISVIFRGLGGSHSVEIRPVKEEQSRHRISFLRKLATVSEYVPRASFDGEILRLPSKVSFFQSRADNAAVYIWLAAMAANAPRYTAENDSLRADLRALQYVSQMVEGALCNAPGLRETYENLSKKALDGRAEVQLPPMETDIEMIVRHLLGGSPELKGNSLSLMTMIDSKEFNRLKSPRGYKPFQPVPHWLELRDLVFSAGMEEDHANSDEHKEEGTQKKTFRSRRHKSDLAERTDSLILHKFEAILSWTEFINLNRRTEDDDPESAKKAADDSEEISLGQISKSPATKLKIHLDLAPEDVDRESISGRILYPEWNARSGSYLKDHVCVLASHAVEGEHTFLSTGEPGALRRIRSIKKQFEAFRPGKVTTHGHFEGDGLDIDSAVRSQVDIRTGSNGTEKIWFQTRSEARDLAVSILLDLSRSTESSVSNRTVIDIEKEALTALAWGLDACGDIFAVNAFSSLKRKRVFVQSCKAFREPMSSMVEKRICSLKPGFYTRLGAALRHVSTELSAQTNRSKLILVITDGKPNDLDHYEGHYGIEDTGMAVREARRNGMAVFGITIDKSAKSWFPRLFGQGGFAVVPHPDKLTQTLPKIYRQLVGA